MSPCHPTLEASVWTDGLMAGTTRPPSRWSRTARAWNDGPLTTLRIRIIVDRGLFLDLDGGLTAVNARRLEGVIAGIFLGDTPPPPSLAIDMVRLTLIDEHGLAVLVRASELAAAAGAGFVLREPRRHVERLLRVAGLGDLVRSDPSLTPAPSTRRPVGAGRTGRSSGPPRRRTG